jgi:S-disulfanyl-L-cysteine oxidoreductase SoxD
MGAAIQLVRCALVGVAIAASAEAAVAQGQEENGRSVAAGVYTAEQAADGEKVFQNICVNCHATSQFTGAAFQKTWAGRPVFGLFDQVRTAMPMDNPGGLSRAEYLAVITYILKLNGLPAGTTALPDDEAALKQIRFAPLPTEKE